MADGLLDRYLPHVVAVVGLIFITVLIVTASSSRRLGIWSDLISAAALLVVLSVVFLFATGRV